MGEHLVTATPERDKRVFLTEAGTVIEMTVAPTRGRSYFQLGRM